MRTDTLTTALRGLCEVFDKTMTPELGDIWRKVFEDFTDDEFISAVKKYLLSKEGCFFPKPGQIYGMARVVGDKEEEASMIADDIFTALRCFGTDKIGTDRAQMKVGEVGWAFILRQGGWDTFSRSVKTEDDVPILKAQARKTIMGLIQRKRSGIPLLTEPSGTRTLEGLGVEMKQLK